MQILGVQTITGPIVLWQSGDASHKVSSHTNIFVIMSSVCEAFIFIFLFQPHKGENVRALGLH